MTTRGILLTVLMLIVVSPARLAGIDIMPVGELKAGMRGVGKSVFSGRQVAEFNVEVIDVMHKVWPRGDMILCRLSGQGLEESGVVAGMSGSPVYIEGRLVGAVAYAWGFAKQAIAGVTPIQQMLDIWNLPEENRHSRNRIDRNSPHEQDRTGFTALPLPVAVSGLTPAAAGIVEPALRENGLALVFASGLSASSAPLDTSGLVPGAAVGVSLIDGDIQASAIGTLTHREGARILAFGHPMFQAGAVSMPLVAGVIHSVLPSVATSFKIFSPTAPLGTVYQDRVAGISGRIGPVPLMIPVKVHLTSPSTDDVYTMRVIDEEQLAGTLVASGLVDAVYQTEGSLEEMTLLSRMKVRFAVPGGVTSSRDSVIIEHVFAGTNPAGDLFREVKSEIDLLLGNRFERVSMSDVELGLEFRNGIALSYLIGARPDRRIVSPGESLRIHLVLRDYRGRVSEEYARVLVPPNAPAGPIVIQIAPRETTLAQENLRAPGRFEPRSLASLVSLLAATGHEDELTILGLSRVPGYTVGDRELPSTPYSLRSVLNSNRANEPLQPTGSSLVLESSVRLGRRISGSARFELNVRPRADQFWR